MQDKGKLLHTKRRQVMSTRCKEEIFYSEVKQCHKLPREMLGAPTLDTLKVRLDRSLSNLFYLKMFLFIAWALG